MDGAFSTFGMAEVFVVEVDMTIDETTEFLLNRNDLLIQALKLADICSFIDDCSVPYEFNELIYFQ